MLMDARKERLGVHAAAHEFPWAAGALGAVPSDPAARREWQRRAAAIGAYRELSGYGHPADPIGPEPAVRNPDLRAAWHEALAALGPAGGPDVRGMTDGLLLRLTDRADWDRATRHQQHLAVAADAELRRRHPGQPWPPLRSAEPQPASQPEDDAAISVAETIDAAQQLISDLTARHREFAHRLAERHSQLIPAEDPDHEPLGPAFPAWTDPGRDAILQPPKPQIHPSQRILEIIADRDPDREAAD